MLKKILLSAFIIVSTISLPHNASAMNPGYNEASELDSMLLQEIKGFQEGAGLLNNNFLNPLKGFIMSKVRKPDIAKIDQILESGANINCRDNDSWTPLMLATYEGNVELVRHLLSKGADKRMTLTSLNWKDYTALHIAQYYANKYAASIKSNPDDAEIFIREHATYNQLIGLLG